MSFGIKGRITKNDYLECIPSKRRDRYKSNTIQEYYSLNDSGTLNCVNSYSENKWIGAHLERNIFDSLGNKISYESWNTSDSNIWYSQKYYYDNKSGKIDSFISTASKYNSNKVYYSNIENGMRLEIFEYFPYNKVWKTIRNITCSDTLIESIDSLFRSDKLNKIDRSKQYFSNQKQIYKEKDHAKYYYKYYPNGLIRECTYFNGIDNRIKYIYEYYK
ncbi:MAG: hypothetical protein SGJ10_01255 [Bacteroidota bacterium]|nr:hypothetical protein [Bacteroidota bacterium]